MRTVAFIFMCVASSAFSQIVTLNTTDAAKKNEDEKPVHLVGQIVQGTIVRGFSGRFACVEDLRSSANGKRFDRAVYSTGRTREYEGSAIPIYSLTPPKDATKALDVEVIKQMDEGVIAALLKPATPVASGTPHLGGHSVLGKTVFLKGSLPKAVDHSRFSAQVERIGVAEFTSTNGQFQTVAAYKVLRFKLSQ